MLRLTLMNKILRKIRKTFYLNQIRPGPRFGRLHFLLRMGDTLSGRSIKMPTAASIVELQLGNTFRNGIVDDKPAERHNAAQRETDGLRFTAYRNGLIQLRQPLTAYHSPLTTYP